MKIETIAIHAGHSVDEFTGAVNTPIHLTTTFKRNEDGGYTDGNIYTRQANPNRTQVETCLAALEGGEVAAAFSSGQAAGMSVFQSLSPGDHIIAPLDMYHGMRNLLNQIMVEWKLEVSYCNYNDIESNIKSNTKLIWVETPSNPLLKITDLRYVAELAQKHQLLTCCDSTFATPIFQRPIELGFDLVMHASTKYLNGHSDVLGGVIVSKNNDVFFERIRNFQHLGGAVPSPFDCYLLLRGLKTLPWRMKAHEQNAIQLAHYLENHPNIERVFYPGLASHPDHALAKNQMSGFSGMISILVKGDEQNARKVANKTHIFTQATSLGGVESLIEHRASIEGDDTKTPRNLLRLSVGLENVEDLMEDLDKALRAS